MTNITVLIREDKSIILFFRMDRQFLMEYLRRLRRRRKICLRQSILYLDLCAAAPGRFFACAGDLPQISHGFHPGVLSCFDQYVEIYHSIAPGISVLVRVCEVSRKFNNVRSFRHSKVEEGKIE